MAIPEVGDEITYQPEDNRGFGERAKGSELSAEMRELDLKPGTSVRYFAQDADSGWPIIQWRDDTGLERLTTIEPDRFEQDFS
jgi:hypothetical protein